MVFAVHEVKLVKYKVRKDIKVSISASALGYINETLY